MARVVLVESGPRHLSENLIQLLKKLYGEETEFTIVTCYGGTPAGFRPDTDRIFQVCDYQGRAGRSRLYRALRALHPGVLAIICAGVPIMTIWKWALVCNLPAKVMISNENGDFFWFDRTNWRIIRHFISVRAGLSGGDTVRTLSQVVLFPFTLTYLLLYAGCVHLRRGARLMLKGHA